MALLHLTDVQWIPISAYLRTRSDLYLGNVEKSRNFIAAVLWMTRSGAPWRLLPEAYGPWNSLYKRFARWSRKGVWADLFKHFSQHPDLEHLILDSTVVRAHACAAGAQKKVATSTEGAVAAASPANCISPVMVWVSPYALFSVLGNATTSRGRRLYGWGLRSRGSSQIKVMMPTP